MTMSTDQDSQGSSTRPYLIRALHDWCTDNGFTPYLAVYVDRSVQVPQEYVKNNDFVQFKARFGGVAREISVPVDHVIAIYARENGQGMAFPVPSMAPVSDETAPASLGDVSSAQVTSLRSANPPAAESRTSGLRLARGAKTTADSSKDEPQSDQLDEPVVKGEGEDPPPEVPPPNNGRPALRRIK